MKNELNIVMPMFNAENTIIDTLKSLDRQTNKSFELIIVDDGSTDNSVKLVEKYISENNNFPVKIIVQKNGGPSEARNTGIKNSNLKYVMFIDSDDFYEENMVQTMLSGMKNEEIQLVTCGILKKSKKKKKPLNMKTMNILGEKNIANIIEEMQVNEIFNSVANKIYCINILKEHNILFNNKLSMGEDFQFNLFYFDKINGMRIDSSLLYLYNTNESFITYKIRENDFENRKENIELLSNYYKKNGIDKDLSFQYIKIFYSEIFNTFKANGYFQFKKNNHTIYQLLTKDEIINIRKTYNPDSKISNILFFPIKIENSYIIYLIAISAMIGKRINIKTFNSKSM